MTFDKVPGWAAWLAQDADGAWHSQGVGRGCPREGGGRGCKADQSATITH